MGNENLPVSGCDADSSVTNGENPVTTESSESPGTAESSELSTTMEPAGAEGQRVSTEVVEVEPESIRPLPPSLRLKSAQESTS